MQTANTRAVLAIVVACAMAYTGASMLRTAQAMRTTQAAQAHQCAPGETATPRGCY